MMFALVGNNIEAATAARYKRLRRAVCAGHYGDRSRATDAHWASAELWAESRGMTGRAAKYLIGG